MQEIPEYILKYKMFLEVTSKFNFMVILLNMCRAYILSPQSQETIDHAQ